MNVQATAQAHGFEVSRIDDAAGTRWYFKRDSREWRVRKVKSVWERGHHYIVQERIEAGSNGWGGPDIYSKVSGAVRSIVEAFA